MTEMSPSQKTILIDKMSDLHRAIEKGNIALFIKVVMKGEVDINAKDTNGRTPLHIACKRGSLRIVKYLLRFKGADPSLQDNDGKTALQLTSQRHIAAMTLLFSEEEAWRQSKQRKKEENAKNIEAMDARFEDVAEDEEADVSPTTIRKCIICLILPLLFLLFVNGFWFALKFTLVTVGFYYIVFAYVISEVAVRPPWYHQPIANRDGLRMRDCPTYWQGWINDPKTDLGLHYEDVRFKSTGKYTLRGWHIPPPPKIKRSSSSGAALDELGNRSGYSSASPSSPSTPPVSPKKVSFEEEDSKLTSPRDVGLVLVHGGGRDRRAWLRHSYFLHAAGYGCLLFDLREHGLSDGKMRGFSFGMDERYDVVAAVHFMRHELNYKKICVIGTSVGGSSVLMAAAIEKGIDAVIAENAITTCASLLDHQLIVYMGGYLSHNTINVFLFKMFRRMCTFWLNCRVGNKPSKRCQALHCIDSISPRPILLMHGTNDVIVPHRHSEILFERAKEPKELYLCESAFHCGLYNTHPEEFEERVLHFLSKLKDQDNACNEGVTVNSEVGDHNSKKER